MVKHAIAVIHGIGESNPNFAEGFIDRVRERIRIEGLPDSAFEFTQVYWGDVLLDREDELFKRLCEERMDYKPLRHLMVQFHGNSLVYDSCNRSDPRSPYRRIHARIDRALGILAAEAGGDAPLTIIAHSLGTVVLSNYLWDLQHPNPASEVAPTALERGQTLANVFTLGSPLPLWALRHADFGKPFRFPVGRYAHVGAWVNFYDEDDVLGYPLKHLNPEYDEAVTADQRINVGGPIAGATPMSHLGYWESRSVANEIATKLVGDHHVICGSSLL